MARRPWLWGVAARQAGRLAGRGWWRRPPFLPLPAAGYLAFRLETQYGGDAAGRVGGGGVGVREPGRDGSGDGAGDLVAYLAWVRRSERALR